MRSSHKTAWTCATVVTFILFFYTFSFAQTENIKGVQFNDGSIIYGRVIEMNVNDIRIETRDGKIISRKFSEVDVFIRDAGVDVKADEKESPKTLSNARHTAQDTGLYIGVGGNYALQNFNTSDLNNDLRPYGLNVSFSNAPGFNAKVGYHFSKWFSAEFVYDYFTDFSWNQTTRISGVPVTFDAKVKLMTFMVAGKLSPDIRSEVVRPYITAGAGIMYGKIDATASAAGYSFTAWSSDYDACAKIGAGIDFYVTKNISIGIEGNYVMGFGNMDEIKYANLNLGVAYHF
jgi:opacity protein-like surface antigen